MKRWLLSLWLLVPAPAFACAVCGLGQNDESAGAFFRGTMLLSLMPLSVIGGIVFYLYRATKAPASSETVEPDVFAPHTDP